MVFESKFDNDNRVGRILIPARDEPSRDDRSARLSSGKWRALSFPPQFRRYRALYHCIRDWPAKTAIEGMSEMVLKKFSLTLGACATLMTVAATPSFAGKKEDIADLQQRVSRIEQSVNTGTSATVRIGELETEIRDLTGRLEEMSFQLQQANARIESMSAALAGTAPTGFGDPLGIDAPTNGPVSLVPGDPIADEIVRQSGDGGAPRSAGDVQLPLDPNAAFDYASQFLLNGDYQRAQSAFELYVGAFPNTTRTADAKFRLGEIYLALGDNASAADTFIGHIRAYPNDLRAAEAYLKLGTAFARMEKPTEACKVFKSMRTKFPDASRAVTDRAGMEMARINCQ